MLRILKIALIFVAAFEIDLVWYAYAAAIPVIAQDLVLNYTQVGILAAAPILTFAILATPVGVLQDAFRSRGYFLIGLALASIATVLRAYANSYEFFLLGQLLLGASSALTWVKFASLVAEWFHPKEAGLATGVYFMGWPLGGVAALALTPMLIEALHGWSNAFLVYAWFTIIVLVVWSASVRSAKLRTGVSHFGVSKRQDLRKGLVAVVRSRQIWYLGATNLVFQGVFNGIIYWLPTILAARGASLIVSGLISSIVPIGFAMGAVLLGIASDRRGRRKPFILWSAVFAAPTTLITLTTSGLPLISAGFVLGVSMGVMGLLFAMVADDEQLKLHQGTAAGILWTTGSLGGTLIPVVVGILADLTRDFFLATIPILAAAVILPFLGLMLQEKASIRARL